MSGLDDQIHALQEARKSGALTGADAAAMGKVGLDAAAGTRGGYDQDIYGRGEDNFVRELPTDAEYMTAAGVDSGAPDLGAPGGSHPATRAAAQAREAQALGTGEEAEGDAEATLQRFREAGGSGLVNTRIADREGDYQKRRLNRPLSPGGETSYKERMALQMVENETAAVLEKVAKRNKAEADAEAAAGISRPSKRRRWDDAGVSSSAVPQVEATPLASRWDATPVGDAGGVGTGAGVGAGAVAAVVSGSRWDATPVGDVGGASSSAGATAVSGSRWDATPMGDTSGASAGAGAAAVSGSRWDATPMGGAGGTGASAGAAAVSGSRWDATPVGDAGGAGVGAGGSTGGASRWDQTPVSGSGAGGGMGPKKSRWDETPVGPSGLAVAVGGAAVAGVGARKRSRWDETPDVLAARDAAEAAASGSTAVPAAAPAAHDPELAQRLRWEAELEERNRPLTDEELDAMFPSQGYKILDPPAGYKPIRTPSRKLLATPTPMGETPAFQMGATPARDSYGISAEPSETGLPHIKPEDLQYFGKLAEDVDEDAMTLAEAKERKIMRLLLKIKNGQPSQRKVAMRQITDKARDFGAEALFHQILPLLMSPTLEDQERHLLVKVIDRILYKLDDLVRPFVHKILVVIEPMLIDEDYYARVEGREIISNLAKAAGLATMIATMRQDLDNSDEYVRNTTARAFAVVASALGIPSLLPFLKAVSMSRKSWQARHTGIKIVQQIAILMGCAVLPHLQHLVDIVGHGLVDDKQQVRTITALSLAALAEAAHPYGIEAFDDVLRPLWKGVRVHRNKGLAAFLKAIGFIIPLMEEEHASYYTKEVMPILIREFQTPDEEMKKIVLKVIKQCTATDGVEASYVREEVLPEFFRSFWVRRMALDRRNYRQLVETTVEVANKVGASDIVSRVVDDLKDESEPYRSMVAETIDKILQNLGASDVDERLEERLVDGILFAFQEQTEQDSAVLLSAFGTVLNALGTRCKPYLPQICGTIKWRLNNKSAPVRMQAADLIARSAAVMRACEEEQLMGHLGVVLFEYLGEEYPEVLGSILGALKSICNVIGMTKMQPPIKDLLPRLTPILKNRHEKVQENCIDLVGRIADRGAEHVSAREWMRICFELLEQLKAPRKSIRRAAVNTFGYIAKAIGPQDVLHTLLNNLKVQERQSRVCTTVAIGIVAETCQPFTVLPAMMNEYRVPDLNVQNGVLKALSFMFEYIGEMGKDYIYAVTPLLEDALTDRDLVHRQTACTTVKHIALGVSGLGCDDAIHHMLNLVWPNIFEQSPHVINAVFDAIEGARVALGPARLLQYVLQGLFHPARRVREVYWKLYNSLYMYGADALTPAYPRIEDDGVNTYRRTHLELCL